MHHLSVLALLVAAACSPKSATQVPVADSDADTDVGAPANPSDAPAPSTTMTAEACEAQGGKVVGDIGDGAIHRPGYTCPEGGAPPLGTISAAPDGPVAIEGSVCCP